MNKPAFVGTIARQRTVVSACSLAVVLGMWALTGHAAQTSASVSIVVNLQTALLPPPQPVAVVPATETCSMVGAFGASVTVSCSPGAIRFVTKIPDSGADILRNMNILRDMNASHAGDRIGTSWRWITLDNREYLEMMVRW